MTLEQFRNQIESADALESLIGRPGQLVIRKQLTELDDHMRSFIDQSPFLLLGTVGADGRCDVSPRGDSPSVAKVLDSHTLVLPERRGNRLADSLHNIIETRRVGLLLLIPGHGETLRINGRACVLQDAEVLAPLTVNGQQPVVGIGVDVEECYFQCAKALIRSMLWESRADDDHVPLASFAQILMDETGADDETVESLDQQIQQSYSERLY